MTNLVNKDIQKIRKLITMIQNVKKILLQDNEKYEVLSFFTRIAIKRIMIEHDLHNYMIFKSLRDLIEKPEKIYLVMLENEKGSPLELRLSKYPYASNRYILDVLMKDNSSRHLLFYYLYRKFKRWQSKKYMIERYYPENRFHLISLLTNKLLHFGLTEHRSLNYFTNIYFTLLIFQNSDVRRNMRIDDKVKFILVHKLANYYSLHIEQAIKDLSFSFSDFYDFYKNVIRKI